MTDTTVTKIAALVRELARLRDLCTSGPTDEQAAIMRAHCSGTDGLSAALLAVGVAVETDTSLSYSMTELVLVVGRLLCFLHRDSEKRRVSVGEVLRLMADHADKVETSSDEADPVNQKLRTILKTLSAPKSPDKPGAN